jgi:hypothetical protein
LENNYFDDEEDDDEEDGGIHNWEGRATTMPLLRFSFIKKMTLLCTALWSVMCSRNTKFLLACTYILL